VGRSEKHAYAYFLVPGRESLTEIARKRLRALQEFGELGAGFRLAAADLEIRGAGELLGPKQHGHIASLGFDLYCQMLERAVSELEGDAVPAREAASLHLGVDIRIPDSYMADSGDRLALYKRLAGMTDEDDVGRLQTETEDRNGRLPAQGRNLFDMARLRLLMDSAGARRVDVVEGRLHIRFQPDADLDPARIVDLFREDRGSLTPSGLLIVPAPGKATDRIAAVQDILKRVQSTAEVRG
jgi:transcription-repair coupling factor (superfamily II helicase)